MNDNIHTVNPIYYAGILEMLVFGGAIDETGKITDPEIVEKFAACVAEGACSWPTKLSEDSNITSPDQVFKVLRAIIGLQNLNAQQAAEKTQQWCDEIPMRPFFGKDKHKLERAACSRLKGFYEEIAKVQQNPTSKEAQIYNQRLDAEHQIYQMHMAKTATQQN